ncbi:unnamed protein product [Cuscuta campestris]|uniref:Uncharacterized protein n=1 Tax=Cuscuta campestris TaxID=132261 RepID=A0A484LA92_9ASTE|nr:unnamed protein product [Cuscuta campestris]
MLSTPIPDEAMVGVVAVDHSEAEEGLTAAVSPAAEAAGSRSTATTHAEEEVAGGPSRANSVGSLAMRTGAPYRNEQPGGFAAIRARLYSHDEAPGVAKGVVVHRRQKDHRCPAFLASGQRVCGFVCWVTTDQEGINTKTFYCLLFFVGRGADDSNPKALVYLTKTLDEGERDEQRDSFIVIGLFVLAMDLLNYKLQLCWSSLAARTWVLKLENLDEFEVLLVFSGFILVTCTLGSMGLEILLPWTVEAEFGITCCFPLDATMVLLCLG